jgi:hypothetical protein
MVFEKLFILKEFKITAVIINNLNITNTLIGAGALLNITDNYGSTVLDYGKYYLQDIEYLINLVLIKSGFIEKY